MSSARTLKQSWRHGIVCGGCWTLDRIKMIDRWPQQESLAVIKETDRQGGGSAHNLGIDIRKLDPSIPVEAIGMVGKDADGDFLQSTAVDHGVNVEQLHRTDKAETSYTDVMADETTGKRTFFHHQGCNNLLTPDHFDFSASQCKLLHLGLLGVHQQLDDAWGADANGWVSVLKKAKAAGLQTNVELVSIDPERIRELCLPCLPWLDTLIVNDYEIGALANIETMHAIEPAHETSGSQDNGSAPAQSKAAVPAQCVAAARQVLQLGAMSLVVVHYPAGAVCVCRDGQVTETLSVQVDSASIVNTVGAGDAFAAGMLYGLHESWSVDASLQLAHAVAAASLRSRTTVGSVESVERCLALADR